MISIVFSEEFFYRHPNAKIGLLEISGINNDVDNDPLLAKKQEIDEELRRKYSGFSRPDFNALPIIAAYRKYYKQFKKSYHVQLQLESIVLKGKSFPNLNPLVDISFMAEMNTFLLSAGHDVSKLEGPITMDISREGDVITQLNGKERKMRTGDMIMRDGDTVACSIIYGQDNRSPISKATTNVLYVTYCPKGIDQAMIGEHHRIIREKIKTLTPDAVIEQDRIVTRDNHPTR